MSEQDPQAQPEDVPNPPVPEDPSPAPEVDPQSAEEKHAQTTEGSEAEVEPAENTGPAEVDGGSAQAGAED